MTDIQNELLDRAFVGMQPGAAQARGELLRKLDGDFDKFNALAQERGLDHGSDYIHRGHSVADSKVLKTPTKLQENTDNSNPWRPDTQDSQGKPDWSAASRRAQTDLVKRMGVEHASRLAESAGSFLGAPRPGAKDLTPRHGNKDQRTSAFALGSDVGRG